jgi:hypothetical protein
VPYEGKVLDETSIKLNHTIKNLNLLWIDRYCMFNIAWIFLGSSIFPSLEIMKLKISSENTYGTFLWVKIDFIFSAFLKTKSELHQMTLHIIIKFEIIQKYFHELV